MKELFILLCVGHLKQNVGNPYAKYPISPFPLTATGKDPMSIYVLRPILFGLRLIGLFH